MNSKNRVVVLAPHADDEVIGCGATIAKHSLSGDYVYVVICTNAANGAPDIYTQQQIELIREEALNAHKILKVHETIFLDFPAPALNSFPEFQISLAISKILESIKPTHLFLPHPGDIHQDHKAIYRSALVSGRPTNSLRVSNIFCYETLSETEWTPMQESPFIPSLFVNVSECFDYKLLAMQAYKSQLKSFPHSRSLEALEALAKFRGATVCFPKAEAFSVERLISL